MKNIFQAVCVDCGYTIPPAHGNLIKLELPIPQSYNTDRNGVNLIPTWYVHCLDKESCKKRHNEKMLNKINLIFKLAKNRDEMSNMMLEYIADEIRGYREAYGFYE